MGVISFGRSSSRYDKEKQQNIQVTVNIPKENIPKDKQVFGNPNPDKYEIIKSISIGSWLIIEIKYLDCFNYEGKKILVYKDTKLSQLMNQKHIDPHFSENKKFLSPFARFEPTDEGWNSAVKFCKKQ